MPPAAPVYAGNSNINGYNYNIAASTFSNNVYNTQQTQLAQGLSLASAPDGDFAWELIASRYRLSQRQAARAHRRPARRLHGGRRHGKPHERHRLVPRWTPMACGAAGTIMKCPSGLHRDAETFAQTPQQSHRLDHRRHRARWSMPPSGRTATNAVWLQDIWTPAAGLESGCRAAL